MVIFLDRPQDMQREREYNRTDDVKAPLDTERIKHLCIKPHLSDPICSRRENDYLKGAHSPQKLNKPLQKLSCNKVNRDV